MLTPLDIETKEFKSRIFGGYSRKDVEEFLEELLIGYTKLYSDNKDLKVEVQELNEKLSSYKQMEDSMKKSLMLAEKASDEFKSAAHEKADRIIEDAENKAREIINNSHSELTELRKEITELNSKYEASKIEIRNYLKSQLEFLEKSNLSTRNTAE